MQTARDQIVSEPANLPQANPGIAVGTAGGGNPALAILINLVQTGCYRSVLK
jgi:hypothetical protein